MVAEASAEDGPRLPALARAMGTVVTVHLEYARREAQADAERMIGGVVLAAVAGVLATFAIALAHVAGVLALAAYTELDALWATLAVGGGDLLVALVLGLMARGRLRGPVLKETRSLVGRTVKSFAS